MDGVARLFWKCDAVLLQWIRDVKFLRTYTADDTGARITLFLCVMGLFALVNELYITVEMSFVQKETYEELRQRKLEEALKTHRMVLDDSYHGKEYLDEKTGLVIEEFENREKFFAKPVHVAHVYVESRVLDSSAGERPIFDAFTYHIEFSPEEYESERRPEFGAALRVLRRRLYHLFKDSDTYRELAAKRQLQFTVSNGVRVYNSLGETLTADFDDVQLCFLKMETGDTIRCDYIV
ncbi:ADR247Wp [Eremothecium gossypii ATCC 10895]|uniref:ADR247Wp n=1 Tax=Eremothecium gossypii (strain ATCC 10895 / CBS 109.51 / FGSC 9923 / NRRL Y-1056) TaxID=284811 RepID=Q759M9_EREGS|nr:ADR247Wp [Eremothecium gossypii ATCC 10895]AAS52167.1 ADR247Wp [Eremothecium gossypii ATCC 10895]